MIYILFGGLLATLAITIAYFKWTFQYWSKRQVETVSQPKIPFGTSVANPLRAQQSDGQLYRKLYDETKARGLKFSGLYSYTNPVLLIADLDLLKQILTKDFDHFIDRGQFANDKVDPLSTHLFSLTGDRWRHMRTTFSPTFTSGKLTKLFDSLTNCEDLLQRNLTNYQQGQDIDIKQVLARYVTDIIGSCTFGLDFDSFKDEQDPFRVNGAKIFQQSKSRKFLIELATNYPSFGKFLGIKMTPEGVTDFFDQLVSDITDQKAGKSVKNPDFLQHLIEIKKSKPGALTEMEIVAQTFIFFLFGYETVPTTMTFALYELSKNQAFQHKLREEINATISKFGNKITYESLNEMTYLEQVIDETLRKYPPIPLITRECVKDYKIPNSDVTLEKGTKIAVPIYGIQMDPENYENPLDFDPDRFSNENKRSRHPYSHIPFGEGPRKCIGQRFGLLQVRLGLASLLKSHKFTMSPKTIEPLQFDKNSFTTSAEGGIWLNAQKV